MKKVCLWLLSLGILAACVMGFRHFIPNGISWPGSSPILRAQPQPDAPLYRQLCQEIEEQRQLLSTRLQKAGSAVERKAVENEARQALESYLPRMMRCWLGTRWDFNGMATVPGEGKIACGYFVSTILRDAGFRVERIKLAQQASQNILGTFVDRADYKVTVGTPYDAFCQRIRAGEPGIMIVGLDSHVAFLVNDEKEFRMIHSSGASPWAVVDETQAEASVLARSNYRVVGHLTSNRGVIRKWLDGKPIPVQMPGKR